ncbi:hypothetical protein GCG54_00014930 [Colletotrichum gloeosporioides]|uniref:Uncharacterized protein n=1 Tax=Colletotrichum gloeosporioides TaxID=474922 RepID=A0A8H4CDE8_COLGL|nr:uncharacterized protein GCG54_00014930 [Colletotrichum gloeosporioides]KAF3801714.1 hypothetical protein GCG54_00014930 [Colletotrichum gloeosporioides]
MKDPVQRSASPYTDPAVKGPKRIPGRFTQKFVSSYSPPRLVTSPNPPPDFFHLDANLVCVWDLSTLIISHRRLPFISHFYQIITN